MGGGLSSNPPHVTSPPSLRVGDKKAVLCFSFKFAHCLSGDKDAAQGGASQSVTSEGCAKVVGFLVPMEPGDTLNGLRVLKAQPYQP